LTIDPFDDVAYGNSDISRRRTRYNGEYASAVLRFFQSNAKVPATRQRIIDFQLTRRRQRDQR
jgi:hypothetical protein